MDWGDLQVLAVLSREGTLAGAARMLGVNHATISRRISALEHHVGEKLIRRLARSTPLTEKGHAIAALALEMEERAQKIERIANLAGSTVSGIVRLTAPPALLSETLIPTLASIGQAHPNLQLALVADTQISSLDRGEADIAIRLVEPAGKSNIVRKLGEISYSLYGTADHVGRPPSTWQFIGFESSLANTPQQQWLNAFAEDRPFRVISNNFHAQMSAAESGMGLAMLPDRIASHSRLLVRACDHTPPVRTAWLVIHQDVASAPAIRIVADAVVAAFQQLR